MKIDDSHASWRSNHDHIFDQDKRNAGERRTFVVVVITAIAMLVEIGAGLLYGSMALLADGLHMASHAVALGIAVFAYRFARKHAADPRFSFGTGKVNSLAGYSGSILLFVFAVGMAIESVNRFIRPVEIAIDQALVVAVVGLVVNGASVIILGLKNHRHEHGHRHSDHNYRSAYLHVVADALTSILAIVALMMAKFYRIMWLDPMMGVIGAILISKWSIGLLTESGRVLLDTQVSDGMVELIRSRIENEPKTTVSDLHVWTIGPGKRAAIIAIESPLPKALEEYRAMLPSNAGLSHVSIEISRVAE